MGLYTASAATNVVAFYRYQEWKKWLHYFNDRVILTLYLPFFEELHSSNFNSISIKFIQFYSYYKAGIFIEFFSHMVAHHFVLYTVKTRDWGNVSALKFIDRNLDARTNTK